MKNLTKIYFLTLLVITSCWSYKPEKSTSNPIIILSLTKPVTTENKIEHKKTKKRPEISFKKNIKEKILLYNFESEMAHKFRNFANSKELNVVLSQDISLDLLLCIAYEKNPSLKSSFKKWESVKERYSQEFFLQNLLEQYSSFTRTLDIKISKPKQRINISRNTPAPGTFTIIGEIINTEVELSRLEYIITLRDLITQITQEYTDLIYAKESFRIQKEHLEIAISLENIARDKFRAGLTGYEDVLKAQILRSKVQEDNNTYEKKVKVVKVRILTSLNLPISLNLGSPIKLGINKSNAQLENVYKSALKNRQEIKRVQLKGKKLEQIIFLSKDKIYPDLTIGLSYFENRNKERIGTGKQEEAFPDTVQQMKNINFSQRNSYLQEIVIKREALKEELKSIQQETIKNVKDLHFQIDKNWRQIMLHKNKLIPLAKETLKVIRVSYQAGKKVDFLNVLDSERTLLDFSLSLEKNKRKYHWEKANLEKIIGQANEE